MLSKSGNTGDKVQPHISSAHGNDIKKNWLRSSHDTSLLESFLVNTYLLCWCMCVLSGR